MKKMKLLIIFFFIFRQVYTHGTCNNPITELEITSTHQNESLHVRSKRAPQNIRISRYYDDSYDYMPNRDAITNLIFDPAIEFWQNTIMVKNPLSSPLLIDRACSSQYSYKIVGNNRIKVCNTTCATTQYCYGTKIPDKLIQKCYTIKGEGDYDQSGTSGVGIKNTDLLIIITHKTDACTGTVLAYAVSCQLEYTLDRPVIGLVNICPGKLNTGVGLKMSIATIKHEIAHILGFASSLFAFYRNKDGSPLTPRDSWGLPNLGSKPADTSSVYQYSDNTVKDIVKTFNYNTGQASKTVSYIVTPTVQKEARAFFNCSTMEGLMLEDYGTASSSLSHFEKLYLQNELMTATISVQSLASRLTLAVLQDTGWYMVNMDKADNFVTAKDLGCDFVTKSCFDYMNMKVSSSQSLAPFCNQSVITAGLSCTKDMLQQVYCDLYNSSRFDFKVPAQYQYFPNTNLVSSNPYSDYCPSLRIFSLYGESNLIYTGECTDSQNSAVQGTENDHFNQGFGANSICVEFDKRLPWYYNRGDFSYTLTYQGAGCYQYQCLSGNTLVIIVNDIKFNCTTKGQIIDVSSKNIFGTILCPDVFSICTSSFTTTQTSSILTIRIASFLKIEIISQIWLWISFFLLKP